MDTITSGYRYVCRKRPTRGYTALQNHDQNLRPNYGIPRNEQTDPIPDNPNSAMLVQRNFVAFSAADRSTIHTDFGCFASGVDLTIVVGVRPRAPTGMSPLVVDEGVHHAQRNR